MVAKCFISQTLSTPSPYYCESKYPLLGFYNILTLQKISFFDIFNPHGLLRYNFKNPWFKQERICFLFFFSVKNLKLLWVFTLGLEIWPRLAHFPRLRGAETEALDLRDRDETETLKNSVSRPRHVSRHYSSGYSNNEWKFPLEAQAFLGGAELSSAWSFPD